MPNPAKYKNTEDGKKKYMRDCLHETMHVERKDKDRSLAQCLNVWKQHHKKAPKKKMAMSVAASFLNQV